MRKVLLSLLLLMALTPVKADEGMWMLPTLDKTIGADMKKLGLRIDVSDIYDEDNPSIKDAVANFAGGCTAEIISDRGLLLTNHHCGFSYIQSLSTPEHNYLEDGFWAMRQEEEIPVPGLHVTFLQRMVPVHGGGAREMMEKLEKEYPNSNCRLVSFYNGTQVYILVEITYLDVRLVGTPPVAAGKFGGETDNWMWPRHTCDFSMFRVYADEYGEPSKYDEDNKPIETDKYLSISLKGYEEGDFAMIMGYPGRTQRYQTAAQLEQLIEVQNIRVAARTARQDVMWKAMNGNDTIRLKYSNKYALSANGWKKWTGMDRSFKELKVIERQRAKEADFMKWVNSNRKRRAKYGNLIEEIEKEVKANTEYNVRNAVFSESLGTIELLQVASPFNRGSKRFFSNYDARLDRDIAKTMVEFYNSHANAKDSLDLTGIDLDSIFANTVFADSVLVHTKTVQELQMDPAFKLNTMVTEARMRIMESYSSSNGTRLDSLSRLYTQGLMEWHKGSRLYPDANSTCRFTYGSILGYDTKEGSHMDYYTNMKGVMDKEDPDNYEFIVPARQKELYEKRDFGDYAGPDGEVPVCFITNNDITGGNSGSPVMDADGNLIGLAFDGNWEAMSGDVIFEPDLQRTICVDIRYVLWMMDKVGGAGYLLDEMNIVR